jgi:ribosomal protein S27E
MMSIVAFLWNLSPARRRARRRMLEYHDTQRRELTTDVECHECHFVNAIYAHEDAVPCWWCGVWVNRQRKATP